MVYSWHPLGQLVFGLNSSRLLVQLEAFRSECLSGHASLERQTGDEFQKGPEEILSEWLFGGKIGWAHVGLLIFG